MASSSNFLSLSSTVLSLSSTVFFKFSILSKLKCLDNLSSKSLQDFSAIVLLLIAFFILSFKSFNLASLNVSISSVFTFSSSFFKSIYLLKFLIHFILGLHSFISFIFISTEVSSVNFFSACSASSRSVCAMSSSGNLFSMSILFFLRLIFFASHILTIDTSSGSRVLFWHN